MKKSTLFLTIFLFFGFLIAEEVQIGEYTIEDVTITLFEEREPEPEPEPEKESEEEQQPEVQPDTERKECCCDVSRETSIDEKPRIFYFEPFLGIKTGLPTPLGVVVDMNFDFLIHRIRKKHNVYLGFDLGFRYSMAEFYNDYGDYDNDKENVLEVPVKVNATFDFKRYGPHVDYLTLRLSAGVNLAWWQEDADNEWNRVALTAAWEIELNLVFKNNIVLKFAFDSVAGIYPDHRSRLPFLGGFDEEIRSTFHIFSLFRHFECGRSGGRGIRFRRCNGNVVCRERT